MASQRGVLDGLAILVIEANQDARESMRILLKYRGALPFAAATAREGLSALHGVRPDVVITDIRLDTQDATSLMRELRQRGHAAPFIAISVEDFAESHLRASGFFAFLRKPVDPQRLVDLLIVATKRR
jgi:DNA-binding NtrC family response regulator